MPPARDRITFIGHSTVAIELDGVRLLTDPVLRGRVLHLRRRVPGPSFEALADLDAVLVSHLHADHLDVPSLRRLGSGGLAVGPRGSARLLRRGGLERIAELAVGESTRVGSVEVRATPAAHDGRRWPWSRRREALGYELRGSRRIYFAGDTDLFDGMRGLADGLDVALLPIWGWGPRAGVGHLDPRKAAAAAAMLRPRIVVPIHWGTLRPIDLSRRRGRSRDRYLGRPPQILARHLAELAPGVQARTLAPGESLDL